MSCLRAILLCLPALSDLSCGLKIVSNHTSWDKQFKHTLARCMVQKPPEPAVETVISSGTRGYDATVEKVRERNDYVYRDETERSTACLMLSHATPLSTRDTWTHLSSAAGQWRQTLCCHLGRGRTQQGVSLLVRSSQGRSQCR